MVDTHHYTLVQIQAVHHQMGELTSSIGPCRKWAISAGLFLINGPLYWGMLTMEETETVDGVCEISVSFNILYEKRKFHIAKVYLKHPKTLPWFGHNDLLRCMREGPITAKVILKKELGMRGNRDKKTLFMVIRIMELSSTTVYISHNTCKVKKQKTPLRS